MSQILLVTKKNLNGVSPWLQEPSFILMNMGKEIWLVDPEYPDFEKIKQTAIEVAKTFGDKETIEKLQNL